MGYLVHYIQHIVLCFGQEALGATRDHPYSAKEIKTADTCEQSPSAPAVNQ